jgi:tRNA pseudouridine55 synthase
MLVLDVCCSKGTYVRTLAETLGEALGCGAHLAGLRRTGSGPLDVAQALTLDALEALDEPARLALLLPPDRLLADWPALQLDATEAARFLTGLRRRVTHADCARLRVYGPATPMAPATAASSPLASMDAAPAFASASASAPTVLLGAAHVCAGELIADRLLSPPEVAALQQQAAALVAAPLSPLSVSSVAVPEPA